MLGLNRITGKDKEFLARQLSLMIEAGLPLPRAVEIISNQTTNPRLKSILEETGSDLQHGIQLSKSLSERTKYFSEDTIALLRAGESTGKIGKVLNDISINQEEINEFNSKILSSLIYPIIIIVTVIIVAIYMVMSVIPQIIDLFTEQNITLPTASKVLMSIVTFLDNYWYIVLLVLAVAIIGIKIFLESSGGKLLWSTLQLRLPVIGNLLTNIYISRLCRTLAMLIKYGVPIIDAVGITRNVVKNTLYRDSFDKIISALERGLPLSKPISETKLYPPLVYQMILVGEQSGKLDSALENVADNYKKEATNSLKNLSAIIEPALIIIVGIGVAYLMYAILMPIYQIAQLE